MLYENLQGGVLIGNGVSGAKVYNNLIRDNGDHGIRFFSADHTDTEIFNNTIADTSSGYTQANAIRVTGSSTANIVLKNNVLYATGSGMLINHDSGQFGASDNNVFYNNGQNRFIYNDGSPTNLNGWRSQSGQDSNSTASDPGFVDANGLDFHVLVGGGAVDAGGSPPSTRIADLDGFDAPQGNRHDAGCYEFQSGAGSSSGPPQVTGLRRTDKAP